MNHIIYCGVDFHARQQTVCCLTTETGELVSHELKHDNKDELRKFYAQFSGPVIVGLEASGYSPWFEQLLEELGHQVWLGDAAEIRRRARRRQKNDRRDAELILELLIHDEFPRIHRPHRKVARSCACCVTGISWLRCALSSKTACSRCRFNQVFRYRPGCSRARENNGC
jgi:hypothetical protein